MAVILTICSGQSKHAHWKRAARGTDCVTLSYCWPMSRPNHACVLEIDYTIFLVCGTSRRLISVVRCKGRICFLWALKNRNICSYSFGIVLLRIKHTPATSKGDGWMRWCDVGSLPKGWEEVAMSMCWGHQSLRQSLVHIGQCLPNKSHPVTYDTVQTLPE